MTDYGNIKTVIAAMTGEKFGKYRDRLKSENNTVGFGLIKEYQNGTVHYSVKKNDMEYSVLTSGYKKNPTFDKIIFNINGIRVEIDDSNVAGKRGQIDLEDRLYIEDKQGKVINPTIGEFLSGKNPLWE